MKNEKLLGVIGKIDDDLIYNAVNDTPQMKKVGWFKRVSIAACLAVVLITVLSVLPNYSNQQSTTSPNNSNGVVADNPTTNSNNAPLPATSEIHVSMDSISMNDIEKIPEAARMWYDPKLYDNIVWDKNDIFDYYGRDLTPAYIPDGLAAAPGNGTATVIVDKSGEVALDSVWYGFFHDYDEDGNPKLTKNVLALKGFHVVVSKIGLLNDCIYILPENEVKTSKIGETSVTFGYRSMPYGPYDPNTHEPSGYYDMYVAEFKLGEIEYQIIAEQMEAEEVVKVVSSIIYGEEVIVDTDEVGSSNLPSSSKTP